MKRDLDCIERPYIICHMMTSIDGKISGEGIDDFYPIYDQIHTELNCNAWMCGRVTMEMFAESVNTPLPPIQIEIDSSDFIAMDLEKDLSIAIDTKGSLRWKSNKLAFGENQDIYSSIIVIVTKQTPKEYLSYLKEKNISYIFSGDRELDMNIGLRSLKKFFHVDRLLLEGGGIFNSSMLEAGLIDEISLLLTPLIMNNKKIPSLFEGDENTKIDSRRFTLSEINQRENGSVWLRYKRKL